MTADDPQKNDPRAGDASPVDPDSEDTASRARARRARLARVFGDVLPESTRDDGTSGEPHRGDSSSGSEEWLRSQRPPHYD
nr:MULTISPECIES: hypothetical protein [unclassified Rhodococcus (in: high G+C Gram-positive bacteria)]